MRQRGISLLEVLLVVGILAAVIFVSLHLALGARPFAIGSAGAQFDATLSAARSLAAASGNGATIVFEPAPGGGFSMLLFSGRPTSDTATTAMQASTVPPATTTALVNEATLGQPPFALFVSGSGHFSGQGAYPQSQNGTPVFTTIPSEPACPAGGFTLTFTGTNGTTDTRTLPCITVAADSPQPQPTEPTPPPPSAGPPGTPSPPAAPTAAPPPPTPVAATPTPASTPTPVATPVTTPTPVSTPAGTPTPPALACETIGGTCPMSVTPGTPLARCNFRTGASTSGFLGSVTYTVTQGTSLGTLTDNGNGTASWTRSAAGSVTIDATQNFVTWNPGCSANSAPQTLQEFQF